MKKLLAMMFAVATLSTMAMADEVWLDADDTVYAKPGDVLYIEAEDFIREGSSAYLDAPRWEFNEDYFAITTKKISAGSDMVESIEFATLDNDNEALVIQLEESNSTEDVNRPNLVIEEIVIRARKDASDDEFEYRDEFLYPSSGSINVIVENTVTTIKEEDLKDLVMYEGEFVRVDIPGYDEAEFDSENVLMYGRVYDEDEFKIDIKSNFNKDLAIANPDADIIFLEIDISGLTSSWDIEIPANEDDYLYVLNSNGTLSTSSLKWDDDIYAFTGKTREGMSLVISDMQLKSVSGGSSEETVPNPSTGMHEVLGVTIALGSVALVALAATTVKKK